jgi:hypothetical protein
MAFLITTTGTPATVVIDDLGERTFIHPVVSFDLENEYSIDELISSSDLQSAITGAEITAVDGAGNSITGLTQLIDLQSAYNNSKLTEIITDSSKGAVTIKRGSVADTDNVLETKNGAGSNTFEVTGAGKVTGTDFNDVALNAGGVATNFLDETGNYSVPAGGGGTGKIIHVDSVNGNDGTGTRGELDKPFLTILAASTATGIVSGDSIQVRPGTYVETGTVTLPSGVSLEGIGGYEVTRITGNGTDTVIQMAIGAGVSDFTIDIPNSANNGIEFNAASGVAGVRFIKFNGTGGTTSSGLANTGQGKIIAFEIRYGSGDLGNLLLCSDGILACQAIHVPGTGAIQRMVKVISPSTASNRGRLQLLDANIGNANVEYGVEIGTNGIGVLISNNFFNLKNGLLFTGDNAQVDALGGKIQTTSTIGGTYPALTGYSIVVDPATDLPDADIKIDAQMEPNFYWNNATNPNAANSKFAVELSQKSSETRNAGKRLFGEDFIIGFPERGQQFMTGEGSANATFNHVVQLNAAGAFVADITDAAASKTGSTFTFNTLGAGAVDESIAWCSQRRDQYSDYVKHWGIIMKQSAAGTNSGTAPTYVFEIWNGAAWAEVGVEAISVENQYRYANDVFLRASSMEQIRMGISPDTAWATTTINSVTGYWARVRISNIGGQTAPPTFDQILLTPSHTMWNQTGQKTAHGLSMWRNTLFGIGNSFSELEGFVGDDGKPQVGTMNQNFYDRGWQLKIKKSHLDEGAQEGIGYQFNLPGGTCTAYPLKLRLTFGNDDAGNGGLSADSSTTIGVGLLPIQVEGTLVADPAGGITPVARSAGNTGTYSAAAGAGDAVIQSTTAAVAVSAYKLVSQTFEFDISDIYEDDILTLCVQNIGPDAVGTGDVTVWTLQVEGVAFTDGKIL